MKNIRKMTTGYPFRDGIRTKCTKQEFPVFNTAGISCGVLQFPVEEIMLGKKFDALIEWVNVSSRCFGNGFYGNANEDASVTNHP
jgi:hypothetical protein